MDPAAIEKFRAIYTAVQRADPDELQNHLAHDIEWALPDSVPWGGVRHGHLGVAAMFEIFQEHFDGMWAEPDEVIGEDDTFVVLGRMRATARSSGVSFEVPFAHLWRMSHGVPTAFRGYNDTAPIIAALAGESPVHEASAQ